jgi:hypothetical protein
MIPDWLTVDVLTTGGLSSIVGGTVLALIRGWLVSARQVDRLEKSYQRQLVDAWASANAHSARADVLQAQQQRLMEAAYPVLGKVVSETA